MNGTTAEDLRITRSVVGVLRSHDLSGFEIWQWLGPVHGTSIELTESNLYPTLYRLEAEGHIRSSWQEDGQARRKYRMTATGVRRAEREGWGPIAARRSRGGSQPPTGEATREAPPGDGGQWNWPDDALLLPGDEHLPPGSLESTAIEAYLNQLAAGLRLDELHLNDVRHEVGDHISDSSTRRRMGGATHADATAQVLEALGPADALAESINQAQMSSGRLRGGIGWGIAIAAMTSLLAFSAFWFGIIVGGSLLVGIASQAAAGLGLNIYAPTSPELGSQGMVAAACAAFFVGGRQSTPFVALRSRRAESVVWPIWAVIGAIPIAILAGLVPISLDPLTVAVLVSMPGAWVLGTTHPSSRHGDSVSARGLAIGAVLIFSAMLVPGGRIWDFDASTAPAGSPPAAKDVTVSMRWVADPDPSIRQYSVIGLPADWYDVQVELWPAERSGVFVIPDSSAGQAVLVSGTDGSVDFTSLPGDRADWWVTVTAADRDGRRCRVHSEVQFGAPSHPQSGLVFIVLGTLFGS
jgi:DNA-binding PadR family transcriptional regulator